MLYQSFAPADLSRSQQKSFYGAVLAQNAPLFAVLSREIVTNSLVRDDKELVAAATPLCPTCVKAFANADASCFLVMVRGRSDRDMMEMGKTVGLPRGCCVVWMPEAGTIDVRGFYPKFDNDDHKQAEWETATTCSFFKKWSGFLGQIIALRLPSGEYAWTVCSKNSADCGSEFVAMARAIAEPLMTPALVRELADRQLYLGGEFLSPADDTHGYIAKRAGAVMTCVGEHCGARIMRHWSTSEVMDFCVRFGLPHDDVVTVSGPRVPDIMASLFAERDTMLLSTYAAKLAALVETYGREAVSVRPGTVDHMALVGDVMEGFVVHIVAPAGCQIIKYKLPHYTIRTFFLRNMLSKSVDGGAFVKDETKLERYLEMWCCTDAGRAVFRAYGRRMLAEAAAWPLPLAANSHVAIAERALVAPDVVVVGGDTRTPLTVVVVTGPIGSGKSTLLAELGQLCPACVLVDGDEIVPGGKTNLLGQERNACTIAAIVRGLRAGRPVAVAMGGGVLTRRVSKKSETVECFLPELVAQEFPGCRLELVSVALTGEITLDFTRSVVHDRVVVRKVWPKKMTEPELAKLHARSVDNQRHTAAIAQAAQLRFTLPFGTRESMLSEHFSGVESAAVAAIAAAIPAHQGPELASLVRQKRAIVLVDGKDCRHVTQAYYVGQCRLMTNAEAQTPLFEVPTAGARKVTIRPHASPAAMTLIVLANGKHITMSPGPLAAKDMARVTEWFLTRTPVAFGDIKLDDTAMVSVIEKVALEVLLDCVALGPETN
jgi:hypothetical protein